MNQTQQIQTIKMMVENGLFDIANGKIKEWGLKLKVENGQLIDPTKLSEYYLSQYITVHPSVVQMKEEILKLEKVDDPVLIIGPSGTGKELIARALHGNREGRFVAINCAGIPETLIESELFGHVRGSFTGAYKDKDGKMVIANGGTLFLDEIGDMPMELQSKLLRALQEKYITKVGGEKEEKINCRIVCATNKNILEKDALFREDLLARISVITLHTMALVDRPCDIVPILQSLPGGKELLEAMGNNIQQLDLRFNVRSLQNWVRRFKILGKIYE